jgi:WD40 repeat protein
LGFIRQLSANFYWAYGWGLECKFSGLKFALETSAICPTKVCRQLPAKSQSLRFLSAEAEIICLPSGANFSPDGKQIVSASADKNLKLWDLSGNCLQTFVGHTAGVSSANFSPDGKQINLHSKPQPYAQQKFADNYPLNPKV